MKLVGIPIAALALLSPASADFKAMRKGYTNLVKQLKQSNRNLLETSIANVNGYGCWCYFDDKVGNGKAAPVDPIDDECRNLHRGYECAVADFGESCVPWTQAYFPVLGTPFLSQFGSPAAACTHTNTVLAPQFGQCGAAACTVETHFTNEYTTITQSYNPQFSAFSHGTAQSPGEGGGTFNAYKECKIVRKYEEDKSPRKCCGSYPYRYPFKAFSFKPADEQECCDGSIYRVATHCCKSDVVTALTNGQCI